MFSFTFLFTFLFIAGLLVDDKFVKWEVFQGIFWLLIIIGVFCS